MTVTVERVVLATDGSASAATAAAHALFLARVLDASLQAVSATGTPQSSATETTETETAGASASAAFEAEEAVGAVTRRALLAGVRLTSEVVGGPAATAVVLGVGGDDEARLAGTVPPEPSPVASSATRRFRHSSSHRARATAILPGRAGDDETPNPFVVLFNLYVRTTNRRVLLGRAGGRNGPPGPPQPTRRIRLLLPGRCIARELASDPDPDRDSTDALRTELS